MNFSVHVHESKEIAAHPAEMRRHHRHCCAGGERSVDGVAAERQHVRTRLRRRTVSARDDTVSRVGSGTHFEGASVA
jgi:hypothetical protein